MSPLISVASAVTSLSVRKGSVSPFARVAKASALIKAIRRIGSKAPWLQGFRTVMRFWFRLAPWRLGALEPHTSGLHSIKRRAPVQTGAESGEADEHAGLDA